MSINILLVLPASSDPAIFEFILKNNDEIQGVDLVAGDSKEGYLEALSAFSNGYSVVITDLFFGQSTAEASLDIYESTIRFKGFELIQEGMDRALAMGYQANFVVSSAWDSPTNIFECYRLKARSFISQRHPLSASDLVDSVVDAAAGITSYPNMQPSIKNIATGIESDAFNLLTPSELQIVDMLVNDLSTKQIQTLLNSVSQKSTIERIAKIIRKIGLQNRENLIAHALEIGMERHTDPLNSY